MSLPRSLGCPRGLPEKVGRIDKSLPSLRSIRVGDRVRVIV
jgi:hypothetical protein